MRLAFSVVVFFRVPTILQSLFHIFVVVLVCFLSVDPKTFGIVRIRRIQSIVKRYVTEKMVMKE